MSYKDNQSEIVGTMFLLTTAMVNGIAGTWIKFLAVDFNVYEQVIVRVTIAIFFISTFYIIRSIYKTGIRETINTLKSSFTSFKITNLKSKTSLKLLGICLLGPISILSWTNAALESKIAIATFSFFAGNFLAGTLVAVYAFKDKMNPVRWSALSSAILGVAVFANPFSAGGVSTGVILGIISGVLGAIINGFKKSLGTKINHLVIILLPLSVTILIFLSITSIEKSIITSIQNASTTTLLYALMFGFIISNTEFFVLRGLKRVNLHSGNIILSTNIVFSAIFAQIILHENLEFNEIIGGALIVMAVIMPGIYKLSSHPSTIERIKYFAKRKREDIEINITPAE